MANLKKLSKGIRYLRIKANAKKLSNSGLFDEEYYLTHNLDVKIAGAKPIIHFLIHGYKEGRNPNRYFDVNYYQNKYMKGNVSTNPVIHYLKNKNTDLYKLSSLFDGSFYLAKNPDVKKSLIKPLVHFVKFGQNEGRLAIDPNDINPNKDTSEVKLTKNVPNIKDINTSIVIPVYNAAEETEICINSVIEHTNLERNELIVINDCSPSVDVKLMLQKFDGISNIKIFHNNENLGYTRTVNKGISLANENDVLLLNSDTEVTPKWLNNMQIKAYSDRQIGTVTAVSDNSGAFSVPDTGTNIYPEFLKYHEVGRLIGRTNYFDSIEVPTGNGFCFYIKHALIKSIGIFDEKKFPKGYGEENEFSMRAIAAGWYNIIDPKTFVHHVRSASFQESKHNLMDAGSKQVNKDYPIYKGATKAIFNSNKFLRVKGAVSHMLNNVHADSAVLKPKIMFVISTRTGGTPQTNMDLMKGIKRVYEGLVLACNRNFIEVMDVTGGNYSVLESFRLDDPVCIATHRNMEYDSVVRYVLYKYSIELLHIRHIAWHSLNLIQVAKSMDIPVVNSFHDFYAICPTVNLLDKDGNLFLEGVTDNAVSPLWLDDPTLQNITPEYSSFWKKRMEDVFYQCDAFVTTCDSAKEYILNALPKLKDKQDQFYVFPHGRDFSSFSAPNDSPVNGKLKVLVPGNISKSKGKDHFIDIIKKDKGINFEFHVLGRCDQDLQDMVIYHGEYSRSEFAGLVKDIAPDVAAVFSIWPETYCHTLTESWACGIPVIGIDLGAVGDRIKKHKAGWVVQNDFETIFSKLQDIKEQPTLISEARKHLNKWQEGYGLENTVMHMSAKYLKLYQKVLFQQKHKIQITPEKIGFVMVGTFPNVPPTAYVRLVDWKSWFENKYQGSVEFIKWQDLITERLKLFKLIVIQRNAIPEGFVGVIIEILKSFEIPYVFEIDDNLLDVPDYIDTDQVYLNYRRKFESLLSGAKEVHVTNENLKSVFSKFNSNIVVRPNCLSSKRWLRKTENIDLNLPKDSIKVLYFGSKTHQKDLDFLIKVIDEINKSQKANLYVVGAGDFDSTNKCVQRLQPVDGRYDKFVEWLISVADNFDLGAVPLMETEFSQYKSYLKCLEFSALRIPTLCSRVAPYLDLVESEISKNIVFLKNDVNIWVEEFLSKSKVSLKLETKKLLDIHIVDNYEE
ncbi:glycosyltransferase [Thalassomonas sp. M1454]|uniref:glycosyltransferase n=1 Tax=Thalassomonas sp. M1454 TaxID=2594477 RepID=UPI00163D4267|nr:glycosyltransferase [Thalassomonas sp. M1454]